MVYWVTFIWYVFIGGMHVPLLFLRRPVSCARCGGLDHTKAGSSHKGFVGFKYQDRSESNSSSAAHPGHYAGTCLLYVFGAN